MTKIKKLFHLVVNPILTDFIACFPSPSTTVFDTY